MIYLNLAAPAFRKIKAKRKQDKKAGAQLGKGLGSNLMKAGFDLGSKALGSEFEKKLINKGIANIPSIFKFGVSKIKNKNIKKALSSDIANMVVDEAQNRAKNKYTTLFDNQKMGGISNFQIENAIKKIGDEDVLDNFVGVFPSNYMNRFINHSAMIEEKKGKYPFIIANTDADNEKGTHWWSILNIEPRNELFFFDSFGLDGLKK